MNMASVGILLFTLTVIYISAGNAKQAFIKVHCKTENVVQCHQQSLLECVIHTGRDVTDAKILVITWKKEGDEEPLLLFNRGQTKQQKGYSFADPSWNDRNMNVSLLISNTAVEHKGVYTCMVMTDSGDDDSHTYLKVTAKYSVPTIQSIPGKMTLNTDGTLTCESDGGYPKGQLRWFDDHNTEWTGSSKMDVKQTESGLFHLSSKLNLMRGSIFSKYTCVVFNASGGKEDEATFEIPNTPETQEGKGQETEGLGRASKIVAPVVVIGSLIAGLLMALLFYRRRSQRDHQVVCTNETDVEEGGDKAMDIKWQDNLA
ncbi:tyrosine-protein kinase-like otk isoform X2 [Enoplosus armatus]|uniref:tyrosine-protein kinase-like otk isoform X2 n=1 Tax=Enoplosus armatus TaxID=215367 RepID=UPI003996C561